MTTLHREKSAYLDYYHLKFLSPNTLASVCASLKKQGKTLATLNGSFDLLHAGHLHILYEASKQADILIVGLNSDASIKAYKSPQRPIIPLEYRLQMMAALGFVDYVTFFEETTPHHFLEQVQPHVHVNGAEYSENCIEAPLIKKQGGRLHLVSLIQGLSTSKIVKKIQGLCD